VVAVGRLAGPPGPGGRPRTLNAWIDPPTAKVLSSGEVAKTFTMVMHQLHGSFLVPGVGRKVVGWMGWAMFVSSATGLWLWWPRHAGFVKGLRWRRGASTLFNLHHMIGFWLCLPLAVLSLTGVYISFPQTSHALFGAPPPPQRAGGPGRFAPPLRPMMSIDQAATAVGAANAAALAEVNYPTRGKAPAWRIGLAETKGPPVRVIDATGEVKKGPDRAEPPRPADPTSKLMRQVHDGNDMGLVWQLIITLVGLAPAILGVSGVVMWLRRRARRRAVVRGATA
jgi:uncharacterized iron-regulated membrane protein